MATKLQIWNRAARAAGETQRIEAEDGPGVVAATLADVYDDLAREVFQAREWPWAIVQATLTEVGEQSISYTGDGVLTEFVVPYDIGDVSQLTVAVDGVELELGTDYTYTAPTGGFDAVVTFTVAPVLSTSIELTVATERVGWEHVWTLPDDCVRPLALLHEGDRRFFSTNCNPPRFHGRHEFAVVPNNRRTGFLLCTDDDQFEVLEYVAHIAEPTVYPPHFVEALVRRLAAHLLDAVKKSPAEAQAMMQSYEAQLSVATAVGNSTTGREDPPPTPALMARW